MSVVEVLWVFEIWGRNNLKIMVNRIQFKGFSEFWIDIQDKFSAIGFAKCRNLVEGLKVFDELGFGRFVVVL